MVRQHPHRTFFTFVDKDGSRQAFSYREARMLSAALVRVLRDHDVRPGDSVAVDLPNAPGYVLLLLAAAYGGFSLVCLNHRLTDAEKLARIMGIDHRREMRVAYRVDQTSLAVLVRQAVDFLHGKAEDSPQAGVHGFTAREEIASAAPRTTKARGRAQNARMIRQRHKENARQDAVEEAIHIAERSAHVFDDGAPAVIMFTSGTTGRPKAVVLSWRNLTGSAAASNAQLNQHGQGLWQAVLPLFHIGGLQVVVRSVTNACPFILYEKFDADQLLADAASGGATHISVVDKMLQDLLGSPRAAYLSRYQCILLGGGALNAKTLQRAQELHANVFASYGMTETSSQIAHAPVTPQFNGGLTLLPGYQAHIVDPGADGFGRLAVRGPGVFGGYLDARAPRTVDGFFLTGDTAALLAGKLFVKERTQDMFVSGGENIYPAEIQQALLRADGVSDAYVFGAADKAWGRRPVAFVERNRAKAPTGSAHKFARDVRKQTEPRLSRLYQPKHLCVLDEFPRTGIGKVDREALRTLYDQRLQVERITLYRVRIPFTKPFHTAKGTLTHRESLIVEVTDHAGRTGLGECVAFPTDWYLPETLDQDLQAICDVLAPLVLGDVFLHPREVSATFAAHPETAAVPLACGAVEPALWDLYGRIVGAPLWQLIGGAGMPTSPQTTWSTSVPAGAVIGIGSVTETVAAAHRCVDAGYTRLKMKIGADTPFAVVKAVRSAFPQVMLTLDANQCFMERDMDKLHALDALGTAWIEEPLDPRRPPANGPRDIFARLAQLQRLMKTPICLDESIARPADIGRALQQPDLRCYAIKIAKAGGVQPTLEFLRVAQQRGIQTWMGGMYDTGISKRLHAAFQTLPMVSGAGDIGATARYFPCDITDPPYTVERGDVTLNRAGHQHGLGCDLNRSSLANVLVDRIVIKR